MTHREAACSCGQLVVRCEGEPIRIGMCHCLACQRRTGSVFGVQARFHRDRISVQGESTAWTRTGDDGGHITYRFCPACGSTVFWTIEEEPDLIGVAVGAFADPTFPPPLYTVYESRRHPWTAMPGHNVERWD